MDDASLPNSVAKDIASVLQVHFDIDGLDSPDLVRLDRYCKARDLRLNSIRINIAELEIGL